MNRRELLAMLGGAGAALAAVPPGQLWAGTPHMPRRPGEPLGPFDSHQADTIARISELIIPTTDTPGAIEARVHEFIAVIVGEWYRADERARFMAGLAEVDQASRTRWNTDFLGLAHDRQTTLLRDMDAEVQLIRQRGEPVDEHFFQTMKGLTLYGYYTSEPGMKQELRYPVIPGRYEGCMPLVVR